jgi:acylphosphatase
LPTVSLFVFVSFFLLLPLFYFYFHQLSDLPRHFLYCFRAIISSFVLSADMLNRAAATLREPERQTSTGREDLHGRDIPAGIPLCGVALPVSPFYSIQFSGSMCPLIEYTVVWYLVAESRFITAEWLLIDADDTKQDLLRSQGVRNFIVTKAIALNLKGYVRRIKGSSDSDVQIMCEGPGLKVQEFESWLDALWEDRWWSEKVKISQRNTDGDYYKGNSFKRIRSTTGSKNGRFSDDTSTLLPS